MEILISGYINYGEENSSSGFSGQISYVVEWNHSTSREAAGFDSPVRERGDGKASKGLSSEGATLCDTKETGCRPSRASMIFSQMIHALTGRGYSMSTLRAFGCGRAKLLAVLP